MVFSSITFLFYFLPTFYAAFSLARFSKIVILVFSLIFYAWGELVFLPLVLIMISLNYLFGLRIANGLATGTARRWLGVAIVVNLLPLLFFKYAMFLLGIVRPVLDPLSMKLFGTRLLPDPTFSLPLPLGISFYTFHALSYLIDVFRRDVKAERSLRDLAVYTLMFPQLIAGPIIRYKTIAGELHNPVITPERVALGIQIFIVGLAQKVLIANTVAVPADAIFSLAPEQVSMSLAWLGIVCYTVQIYFDFSGYSTMAIGLALMIGFTFPLNFNYPYSSQSMTEFWRRWHMSLSAWFRDYLYVPLGGNRISPLRTYLNLCIVFLLCGLWHGASWNFVLWGAAHGLLLVVERMGFGEVLARAPRLLRHVYVLFAVMMTWVLFRVDTVGQARRYFKTLFGFGPEPVAAMPLFHYIGLDVMLALAIGAAAAGPWGARAVGALNRHLVISGIEPARLLALGLLLLASSLSLAAGSYNPFIYFRF
jgi:alginate O-acetyltransferase complex protein AlgI